MEAGIRHHLERGAWQNGRPPSLPFTHNSYGNHTQPFGCSVQPFLVTHQTCLTQPMPPLLRQNGEIVVDVREISMRYLRDWFIVDFLSTVPIDKLVRAYDFCTPKQGCDKAASCKRQWQRRRRCLHVWGKAESIVVVDEKASFQILEGPQQL